MVTIDISDDDTPTEERVVQKAQWRSVKEQITEGLAIGDVVKLGYESSLKDAFSDVVGFVKKIDNRRLYLQNCNPYSKEPSWAYTIKYYIDNIKTVEIFLSSVTRRRRFLNGQTEPGEKTANTLDRIAKGACIGDVVLCEYKYGVGSLPEVVGFVKSVDDMTLILQNWDPYKDNPIRKKQHNYRLQYIKSFDVLQPFEQKRHHNV